MIIRFTAERFRVLSSPMVTYEFDRSKYYYEPLHYTAHSTQYTGRTNHEEWGNNHHYYGTMNNEL